jgi:hypothetical protein
MDCHRGREPGRAVDDADEDMERTCVLGIPLNPVCFVPQSMSVSNFDDAGRLDGGGDDSVESATMKKVSIEGYTL